MTYIEIKLSSATYEFLILLLVNRQSLSQENKAAIIAELKRRNESGDSEVAEPH